MSTPSIYYHRNLSVPNRTVTQPKCTKCSPGTTPRSYQYIAVNHSPPPLPLPHRLSLMAPSTMCATGSTSCAELINRDTVITMTSSFTNQLIHSPVHMIHIAFYKTQELVQGGGARVCPYPQNVKKRIFTL